MAPLRKLAVLLLPLLTCAIAATTPASLYNTDLTPTSSPSYAAAVSATQLSATHVRRHEESAETSAEAEEDEEREEDGEEEEDSFTTTSASPASSASYTDSATLSETSDSEGYQATVTTKVTVTVAANKTASATDVDSGAAATSTSSTTSSAPTTEHATVDAKATSTVAAYATASESETRKSTTAASTSLEPGHATAIETTTRHTKGTASIDEMDSTVTTSTSGTLRKATAVNTASQDSTTQTSISEATDKATAIHTADRHTTADTSTAEATSKAPVSESAGKNATATTSALGTASSSSSAPTASASSLDEVLTKEDKEEVEDFSQEISQDVEPVEDSEECKSLPDDPCASIEELAKNPALQEAYKEGQAAKKAEKEENGDDDDDDDDDDHDCDKDDVECIVAATLGSVGGAAVLSVSAAGGIIKGLGGHPSKVAPWKWIWEAAKRIKDIGGPEVEEALKDLGNQAKKLGVDIGPLRGLGLGLGGGIVTPPPQRPPPGGPPPGGKPQPGYGGGGVVGPPPQKPPPQKPPPGGKPKPGGGEGGKPGPSEPPKPKPEEKPEPEEAEQQIECLEELDELRASNGALQQVLDDIIRDHPDIERPEIDPDDKGKGPEPCKDNEWELQNKQLTDKVSDLQKELDEAIATWAPGTDPGTQTNANELCIQELKGVQDDIRSAPRECLDSDGKLRQGSGNNRPPKTGQTLSEQLSECRSELRKHNDGQNGCEAKTQKLDNQLKQCQADNAKNLEKSKTDMEQLCKDQLEAQKKDLNAEHERALDDARTATKFTFEGIEMTPGQKITLNVCHQRLSDLQGKLDLSQAYCHSKPGEGINIADRGKGKGPVQMISKRHVEDEANLEENDDEWTSEAETAAEDAISLQDDEAAGNSSLASGSDVMGFEYNPPAECNDFLKGCHKRVSDLRLQVDHLKAEQKNSVCQSLVDAKTKERDRYWLDKNNAWNAEQTKKLADCERKNGKCRQKPHCVLF